MRLLTATLLLIAGVNAAAADIRINESRYVDGQVIVTGQTAPLHAVSLDNKYKTRSDGDGLFKFVVKYKPPTCMSDIRAGGEVYSAVISGCLDPGDVDGPLPDSHPGASFATPKAVRDSHHL